MNKIKFNLKSAAVLFITAFLFGCPSDGGDDEYTGLPSSESGAGAVSSSSGASSSSSVAVSSSSEAGSSSSVASSSSSEAGSSSSVAGSSSSEASAASYSDQVYYENGEAFAGSAEVKWYAGHNVYLPSPVGSIANGKIALNLPDEVASEYMMPIGEDDICDGHNNCQNSFKDTDAKTLEGELVAEIPGKGECKLRLKAEKNGAEFTAFYIYLSMAGVYKFYDEYYDEVIIIDAEFSQGWNMIYMREKNDILKQSTNISTVEGNELKWVLGCD